MTKAKLQVRKQQLVRNAIYDAAIELFAAKGFDETTVEEVAQAAGVSRRSFFRYFASKDDLLAQNVVHYGEVLTAAITACPTALTPLETVRETILIVVKRTEGQSHTRQIVEISQRSASARQAHSSRMVEVEDSVATAFAGRLKNASKDEMKPRLLANLTMTVMNVSIMSWYRGEYKDLSVAANQVFSSLTRFICDQSKSTQSKENVEARQKPGGQAGRRQPAKRKS